VRGINPEFTATRGTSCALQGCGYSGCSPTHAHSASYFAALCASMSCMLASLQEPDLAQARTHRHVGLAARARTSTSTHAAQTQARTHHKPPVWRVRCRLRLLTARRWPSMSAITLAQRLTTMRLSPEAFLSRVQTRRCRRGFTLSILPRVLPRLDRQPTSAQIAANSTNTGALPWTVACTDQDCRLPEPKRQRRF